jgi:hypothetical protein
MLLKVLHGKLAHPIVRIIGRGISLDHAELDSVFVNLIDPEDADVNMLTTLQLNARRAVQNFQRLGLVHCAFDVTLDDARYQPILESALLLRVKGAIAPGRRYDIQCGAIHITEFGREFLEACLGPVSTWE